MIGKEKVIEDLYSIYFNDKSIGASDDKIELDIKTYFAKLSKFEVSCLNEYCGLDNINDNVERLALKIMSKFYDRFQNEKTRDIANAREVKSVAKAVKKNSLKKMIISYILFLAGVIFIAVYFKVGYAKDPLIDKVAVCLGAGSFLYLMFVIFSKTNLIITIIVVAVVGYLGYKTQGRTESILFLLSIGAIGVATLVFNTIRFIRDNNISKEVSKKSERTIEKASNDYRVDEKDIEYIDSKDLKD